MTKRVIIILFVFFAFVAGYFIRDSVNTPAEQKNTEQVTVPRQPAFVTNSEAVEELSPVARERYITLAAEYLAYIRELPEENRPSFGEFMNKNRTAGNVDDEIRGWQEKNDTKDIYTINGRVYCDSLRNKNIDVMVAVFVPSDLTSVMPQHPSGITFTDCHKKQFSIQLELISPYGESSIPVSVSAYGFERSKTNPSAFGTNNDIKDVPVRMLAERKDNPEVTIKLLELKRSMPDSSISIETVGGQIISLYGLDNITKLMPDFNVFKTTVSDSTGNAQIKGLAPGSNLLIELMNSDGSDKKISFITQTSAGDTKVSVPRSALEKESGSFVIIPPGNLPDGDITILSRTLNDKTSKHFDNTRFSPLFFALTDNKNASLDLKTGNKSMGVMPLFLKKDAVVVIEPSPKFISRLCGKISSGSGKRPIYSVGVKYTDKQTTTNKSGAFCLSDVNIIDSNIEVRISSDEQDFIVTVPVIYSHRELYLNITAPGKEILKKWSKIIPSVPVNGVIYGDYPYYKSYHAFISGIDENITTEATYIDDKTWLPSKDKFSTSFARGSAGFGRFMFANVKPGRYVIYLLAPENIIHSRIIKVESGKITIVN
ncbi:MAG: hypothetical protein V1647_04850 [Pseudomonadota bacterium]